MPCQCQHIAKSRIRKVVNEEPRGPRVGSFLLYPLLEPSLAFFQLIPLGMNLRLKLGYGIGIPLRPDSEIQRFRHTSTQVRQAFDGSKTHHDMGSRR